MSGEACHLVPISPGALQRALADADAQMELADSIPERAEEHYTQGPWTPATLDRPLVLDEGWELLDDGLKNRPGPHQGELSSALDGVHELPEVGTVSYSTPEEVRRCAMALSTITPADALQAVVDHQLRTHPGTAAEKVRNDSYVVGSVEDFRRVVAFYSAQAARGFAIVFEVG